jgi:hypothetical protein
MAKLKAMRDKNALSEFFGKALQHHRVRRAIKTPAAAMQTIPATCSN